MPLPNALRNRFLTEPRWIDSALIAKPGRRGTEFIGLSADFAAAIRTAKEDLLSQEVREQRRALRLAWSAVAALIVLMTAAAWQWQVAEGERALAEAQTREVQHQRNNVLAELAAVERSRDDWDSALRLSVHAVRLGLSLDQRTMPASQVNAELTATVSQCGWRLVLSGHVLPVRSAAFSPDGSRVVTASADGTARIWDAATAKETAVLRGHLSQVWSAAFSPDGSRIVTASLDKTARIWDVATTKEIAVLRGHEGEVSSAAFSPDGTRIVTASNDKTERDLGCRDDEGDRGAARARQFCLVGRVQSRRLAHRHGVL